MGVDDRRHPRLQVDLPCLRETTDGFASERALNISSSGIALATREILPAGSILSLRLQGARAEIPFQAEVAFLRSSSITGPFLAGLRFHRCDSKTKDALDALILHQLEAADGRRAARRIAVRLKARWEGERAPLSLSAEDLSLSGALVVGPQAPEAGSRGELVLIDVARQRELRMPGQIVWSRRNDTQDCAGISFSARPEVRERAKQVLSWLLLLPREVAGPSRTRDEARLRVGGFALGKLIARGGMCDIYDGRGIEPPFAGIPVALKRLRPDGLLVPGAVDRFATEADLGRMLEHENLARVHASFDFDDEHWMAMDLVEGKSLEAILAEHASIGCPPSVEAVMALGLELLGALRYCHEFEPSPGRGLEIIHGDVTPSNLIVDKQGALKLIDFGIATTRLAPPDESLPTGVATKLSYLAPELYLDSARPTPRVDLYQTAVVLYEMLAGAKPFRGETPEELCRAVAKGPASLRRLNAEVPGTVEQVLLAALSANPRRRPASAMELAVALMRAYPCPPKEERATLLRELANPRR